MKIKLCQINRETDCPCLCIPEDLDAETETETETEAEAECNLGYALEQGSLKDHDDSTTYFSRDCKLESIYLSQAPKLGERMMQPITIDDSELTD